MSTPSIEFFWGLTLGTAALLILALAVVVGILRHQRKIKESEKKFNLLFNQVFDALILLDERGNILDANESAYRLLGYSTGKLIGLSIADICPEGEVEKLRIAIKRVLEKGVDYLGESAFARKDGTIIDVEAGVVSFSIQNRKYILGSFRDITERRRMEVLAATGQMAARIAHEINNPLAGLKNSFSLIKDAVPDGHPDKKFSSLIEKEIERITNIVRQMFVLYKPPKAPAEDMYLVDTIRDVILMLEAKCKQRGVTIDFRTPDRSLETSVLEGSFQQILYNVIVNAIEASPENGVVRVGASMDNRKLKLVISDQGSGISNEIGDRIFEPFFTTKGDTSGGSLGLGLSVSRSLAQTMNGSIEYKSDPGNGTEFTIAWPLSS